MTDDRKLHPSDHFDTPGRVLESGDLSQQDKIEILTSWANEIRQLQVAEEENMAGAADLGEQLATVEKALLELGVDDMGHDAKA